MAPDASGRRTRSGGGRARRVPRSRPLPARRPRRWSARSRPSPYDALMTDHRPWFRVWRAGVRKTVAPFPPQSVFTLLIDSAAGFPDSTAIAFLGKHLNYRQLLQEVERF